MTATRTIARLATGAAAVILDFDGVVVDTEGLKARAYRAAFREAFGVAPDPRDRSWRGLPESEVVHHMLGRLGLAGADVPALIRRKREVYRGLLSAGTVRLIPGVKEFLLELRDRGTPLALATTSTARDQRQLCALHGLEGFFETVVTQEDVARLKPDPEIYVTALERLALGPGACLAFEDTPAGVAAARGAGLAVVSVLSSFPRGAFPSGQLFVKDFRRLVGALAKEAVPCP